MSREEGEPGIIVVVCDVPQCRQLRRHGSRWCHEFLADSEEEAVEFAHEEGWTSADGVQDICPDCTLEWQMLDEPKEQLDRALHGANAYQRSTSSKLLARLTGMTASFATMKEPRIHGDAPARIFFCWDLTDGELPGEQLTVIIESSLLYWTRNEWIWTMERSGAHHGEYRELERSNNYRELPETFWTLLASLMQGAAQEEPRQL